MKDYIDARDAAVESRLESKLDKLPTSGALRTNIWGAAAAIIATILAVLAFGSDRFNGGLSVSPVVSAMQQKQSETDKVQDAKLDLVNQKLDILIKQGAK